MRMKMRSSGMNLEFPHIRSIRENFVRITASVVVLDEAIEWAEKKGD